MATIRGARVASFFRFLPSSVRDENFFELGVRRSASHSRLGSRIAELEH